jgi:hypothetical protein
MLLRHEFSPQNGGGMFGSYHPHYAMGSGGDSHDKNGMLGLSLMPSDFGHSAAAMGYSYLPPPKFAVTPSPLPAGPDKDSSLRDAAPTASESSRDDVVTEATACEKDAHEEHENETSGRPDAGVSDKGDAQGTDSEESARPLANAAEESTLSVGGEQETPADVMKSEAPSASSSEKRTHADVEDALLSPRKRHRISVV